MDRSATDTPDAYHIGWVPFYGAKIFLDSRPLIPRPETEWWVEKAVAAMHPGAHALDLFAGSGCCGIAVLTHVPDSSVDFGEIEARHFPTITKSLAANGIDLQRTRLIPTDVFSGITDQYDLILANPPYIARDSTEVEQSVTDHEPHEALFAADAGFALIAATLSGARQRLAPGGQLWVEHDPGQSAALAHKAAEVGLVCTTHHDQYGLARYSVCVAY